METPLLNTSGVHQLPESATCLSLSEDGQFLSVGHARGLSLWSAASFRCAAEWSQERIEITSVQMTKLAEDTYLLGTIDDMGVARILIYQSEIILLLSVINIMENINNRSICISFQLCQRGDYGVASMCCNGAVWLEVYYFPIESWLKELGSALSQKQTLFQKIPFSLTHTVWPWMESAVRQDLPDAFCLWWSGSKLLLQYSLQKATKNKSDFQSMPGVLWPNANKIVCSAVSGCTRYIALGLSDDVVCVWDRNFVSPLTVLAMSDVDSAFSGIHFMDYCPGPSNHSHSCSDAKLHLLLKCKSGAVYTLITVGRGREPRMLHLTERVKDSGDLPTVAAAVPFLQDLALMIQRNGKMYLQDVINKTNVCSLILPQKHVPVSFCNPIFVLNSRHHTLLIQGVKDPLSTEDSQLYIFRFGECDIVKPYIIPPSDSTKEQETCRFGTLQDLCNRYLQDRRLSAHERAKDIRKTWMQLQETSMIIKQRGPTNHL